MRVADNGSLRLGPSEDRQVPAWPFVESLCAGILLVLEPKENQMAAVTGGEAGDLDIVSKQLFSVVQVFVVWFGRRMMHVSTEELLLIVVARRPSKNVADAERFALYLTEHHFGSHPFGRTLI